MKLRALMKSSPEPMPQLADIQLAIRQAVVVGDTVGIVPLLLDDKRIEIHRRHYETSLITALVGKFPATAWLVGSSFVTEAARHYVREHPPSRPCIAEYGEKFSECLSSRPAADRAPYLREFADFEWCVGQVSIAVDQPAVGAEELSRIPADALPDTVLCLQTGLRYLQASWPIDELLRLYLTETAPDTLEFEPAHVWIEIRGARGEFRMTRLTHGEFMFRKSIFEGRTILDAAGDAAEVALDADAGSNPGVALAALVTEGLVTAIKPHGEI